MMKLGDTRLRERGATPRRMMLEEQPRAVGWAARGRVGVWLWFGAPSAGEHAAESLFGKKE